MHNPYQIYQQSSVQTATPNHLIIMLYDGAIRFTKAGIQSIRERNIERANESFKKAQAVINELTASLNFNYSISSNLASIYEYLLSLLITANLKKDVKPAEEALQFLSELSDAWKQAFKGASKPAISEQGVTK